MWWLALNHYSYQYKSLSTFARYLCQSISTVDLMLKNFFLGYLRSILSAVWGVRLLNLEPSRPFSKTCGSFLLFSLFLMEMILINLLRCRLLSLHPTLVVLGTMRRNTLRLEPQTMQGTLTQRARKPPVPL
uniref:Uncharacterized protein n=1 Tax=Opuntia streptacantha TaxID=393608 RepID=A0A7C8YUF7_OPUST